MKSNNISYLALLPLILGVVFYFHSKPVSKNPTVDVKTNTQIKATTVQVGTFYNGKDGYSIAIPSGNNSTCIWNWEGGSGRIPYSTTTQANTATEKHTVTYDKGSFYNYKVTCIDDFGNQYVGLFPTE